MKFTSLSAPRLKKQEVDVQPQDFTNWDASYLYRTSYRCMAKKKPVGMRQYVMPGYSGYLPGVRADNLFGSSHTRLSKETLNRSAYSAARPERVFPNSPAQPRNSFLGRLGGGLEDEFHSVSRFHGQQTLTQNHPSADTCFRQSTYSNQFKPQEELRTALFRTTQLQDWRRVPVSSRAVTQQSGFVSNSEVQPCQAAEKSTKNSEYRERFNRHVPYHPQSLPPNLRRLTRK